MFRRLFRLPFRDRPDARRAVDDELAFHIAMAVEEKIAEGLSPEEAHQAALEEFGDLDRTRDYCTDLTSSREREAEVTMRIEHLMQDLRYGFRRLRKSPGFTAIVVLTLALGIGANTIVFSMLNPYFLRPLPFGEADELVQVHQVTRQWDQMRHSIAQFEDWMARTRTLDEGALYQYTIVSLTGDEGPERVQMGRLSDNMFDVLRAEPLLGRTFAAGEDGPGGADVTVLSYGLWQRRYAGDPGLVGRDIRIDGTPHTVVGVMPRDFNFPFGGVKLWTPMKLSAATQDRDYWGWIFVGRLAEGSEMDDVQREFTGVQSELAARYPSSDGDFLGVNVLPMREALNFAYDVLQIAFTVMIAAMAFVLILACVNVAGLTLGRVTERRREVAVRAAIGADRGRIVSQFLVEGMILAVAGGVLGIGISYMAVGALGPLLPEDLYKVGQAGIDGRVLAFTSLVTVLTPLLFALTPALTASRTDLTAALKEGGRGASGGKGRSLLGRRGLVVAQVALAIVLIAGAGLMIRSFQRLEAVDLGFDQDRILSVEASLPEASYPDAAAQERFFERAEEGMAAVPGVQASGRVYPLPLNHETMGTPVGLPGEMEGAESWPDAHWFRVSGGYFDAMGVELLAGRTFEAADAEGPPPVIVNRTLAELFWRPGEAVGQTVLYGDRDDPTEAVVVGVVEPVRHGDVTSAPPAQIYLPMSRNPSRRQFVVAMAQGSPGALSSAARQVMAGLDPNLPVAVRPIREVVRENTFQWSIPSMVLGAFGLVALLLASLGIYGVISYWVARRKKEMGIRIALGASSSQVRGSVLKEGLHLTAVGVALGLVAALAAGRVMASVLFGVSPYDPVTLGGVLVLFTTVAVTASLVPALRASRVEPLEVLREE